MIYLLPSKSSNLAMGFINFNLVLDGYVLSVSDNAVFVLNVKSGMLWLYIISSQSKVNNFLLYVGVA